MSFFLKLKDLARLCAVFNEKRKKRKCRKSAVDTIDAGFTFAETLAVLAVTAILTSQAGIGAHKLIQKARVASARNQVEQFKVALQSYYVDCGRFPTSEQGLKALWCKPELFPVSENWNGPYIDRIVEKDPWGFEYQYFDSKTALFPSDAPEGLPYAIVCLGADGMDGGDGVDKDIVSWK